MASEAQKRYLRRHYAEQAELDQDDQWTKQGTGRLSYFEKVEEIQASQTRPDSDGGVDRNAQSDADRPDRDGFPF